MSAPKKKSKERIKVGSRVQLKNDLTSDGVVSTKNAGRGHWAVTWSEGKFEGTITDQSSKSLRCWQLDLATIIESESSDEEDDDDVVEAPDAAEAPAPAVDHAANKRKFIAHAKSLEGKIVKVKLFFGAHIVSHKNFQVRDKKLGTLEWTYVPNGSSTTDNFPTVPGPKGVVKSRRPQFKEIKDFSLTGKKGDLLQAWLRLRPGNIDDHVKLVSADMIRKDPKCLPLTKGEFIVWDGLFLAAFLFKQKGQDLFVPPPWNVVSSSSLALTSTTLRRFNQIKSSILAACGDPTVAGEDKWWGIRPLIAEFNSNRLLNVVKSEILIPDEAMSAFQPRTTSAGDLDHLSFVERKPKKLGTEFKCVADGTHGLMLFLEIQEGKDAMSKKRFRDTHGPATSQAMRLALGVNGK